MGEQSEGEVIMIYEKLSQIQEELFVPKNQMNDFGGFNYRSCEDILKAVKPLCKANKCVLLMDSEVITSDGKTHVLATALLHDLEDGSEIKSTASAREEEQKKGMDGSQISGACLSYARKYALAGLFCIDNEKDSDATNQPDTISKAEQDTLVKLWVEAGGTEKQLLEHCKVKSLKEITKNQFGIVMHQLQEKKDGEQV